MLYKKLQVWYSVIVMSLLLLLISFYLATPINSTRDIYQLLIIVISMVSLFGFYKLKMIQ